MKHDLYDEMMKRNMEKKTRQGLYDFLTYYVSFDNQQILSVFEQEIKEQLGRSDIMGTREYLLDKAKKEGIQAGIEKGIQAGIEKGKRESAIKMLKNGFEVKMISEILGLTVEEIEKLK